MQTNLASRPDRRRPIGNVRQCAGLALLAASMCVLPALVVAEPLELRQGQEVGAGTGFRRGDVCLVLTAAHVVNDAGVEVAVQDRTGGRGRGQVSYANPAYDLALVTLEPGFTVACSSQWPDGNWLASARWSANTMFEARRHYPDGREVVIILRWAGGTDDALSLARADRMEIRGSDSGTLVTQGGRAAGMIRSVDTASDRVDVLRFDLIDRLLGDRFRGLRGEGADTIAFEGVFHKGRAHANWTSYVSAWLSESAGKVLVAPADPNWRCRIRAEVIDWSQRNAENPRYAQAQQGLAGCKTNPLIRRSASAVKFCEDNHRNQLKEMPRNLRVHAVQMKVDVTPRSGSTQSKLRTIQIAENAEAGLSRPQVELQVIQSSFRQTATEVIDAGVCN
jgi:hypothetical protein